MKQPDLISDPKRRRFLCLLGLSFAYLSALVLGCRARAGVLSRPYSELAQSLDRIISNRRAGGDIGRLYLAAHPEENDRERLAGELLAGGGARNAHMLRRKIQDLRVRDFSREDTVIIRGWVLARVEARVCALVHIL